MGDARSEPPDGVHLARLTNLRFEGPALRDVFEDRDEVLRLALAVAMDRHVDARPDEAAVAPTKSSLVDDVPLQLPVGHAAKRRGVAGDVLALHEIAGSHALQVLPRVPEQVAEALIDAEPRPVEAHVEDPDRGRVEGRSVEPLALDQVGRAQAHLSFEHLRVRPLPVAADLETEQVPHAHAELRAVDGLAEKVLGSGAEPPDLGVAVVQGGDDHDENVLGDRVALDPDRHLVPVHPGHHDVEQDEVGRLLRHDLERLFAARREHDTEALVREHDLEQLPVVRLVVHHQDGRRGVEEVAPRRHVRARCSAMVARNS